MKAAGAEGTRDWNAGKASVAAAADGGKVKAIKASVLPPLFFFILATLTCSFMANVDTPAPFSVWMVMISFEVFHVLALAAAVTARSNQQVAHALDAAGGIQNLNTWYICSGAGMIASPSARVWITTLYGANITTTMQHWMFILGVSDAIFMSIAAIGLGRRTFWTLHPVNCALNLFVMENVSRLIVLPLPHNAVLVINAVTTGVIPALASMFLSKRTATDAVPQRPVVQQATSAAPVAPPPKKYDGPGGFVPPVYVSPVRLPTRRVLSIRIHTDRHSDTESPEVISNMTWSIEAALGAHGAHVRNVAIVRGSILLMMDILQGTSPDFDKSAFEAVRSALYDAGVTSETSITIGDESAHFGVSAEGGKPGLELLSPPVPSAPPSEIVIKGPAAVGLPEEAPGAALILEVVRAGPATEGARIAVSFRGAEVPGAVATPTPSGWVVKVPRSAVSGAPGALGVLSALHIAPAAPGHRAVSIAAPASVVVSSDEGLVGAMVRALPGDGAAADLVADLALLTECRAPARGAAGADALAVLSAMLAHFSAHGPAELVALLAREAVRLDVDMLGGATPLLHLVAASPSPEALGEVLGVPAVLAAVRKSLDADGSGRSASEAATAAGYPASAALLARAKGGGAAPGAGAHPAAPAPGSGRRPLHASAPGPSRFAGFARGVECATPEDRDAWHAECVRTLIPRVFIFIAIDLLVDFVHVKNYVMSGLVEEAGLFARFAPGFLASVLTLPVAATALLASPGARARLARNHPGAPALAYVVKSAISTELLTAVAPIEPKFNHAGGVLLTLSTLMAFHVTLVYGLAPTGRWLLPAIVGGLVARIPLLAHCVPAVWAWMGWGGVGVLAAGSVLGWGLLPFLLARFVERGTWRGLQLRKKKRE